MIQIEINDAEYKRLAMIPGIFSFKDANGALFLTTGDLLFRYGRSKEEVQNGVEDLASK